jgi:hypothetical protein
VAAAVAAPPHITPDTQAPAAISAAFVTILNTIFLLPLDDIKQEYAQPDRPANSWNTFPGIRPDKSVKYS